MLYYLHNTCTVYLFILLLSLKKNDVSIGSWLDLLVLDWLDHHERKCKVNSCKADVTTCIFARNSRGLCIPGAAECDFDACKNVLRSILRLRATFGGQLNANRL